MTPETQRIAIAAACGWTNCLPGTPGFGSYVGQPTGIPPPQAIPDEFVDEREALPDYLNDLNAMRDAESILTGGNRQQYYDELEHVLFGQSEIHWSDDKFVVVHASAAQKAEALLKTLNLWEET